MELPVLEQGLATASGTGRQNAPLMGDLGPPAEGGDTSAYTHAQSNRRSRGFFFGAALVLALVLVSGLLLIGHPHVPVTFLKRDQQLLLEYPSDKVTYDGPGVILYMPFVAKATKRQAILLRERKYVVVTDDITGIQRVEAGPKLLFIAAYESVGTELDAYVLKNDQYIKLLDAKSGVQRVLTGPAMVVPQPMEQAKAGVQNGVSLSKHEYVHLTDLASGAVRVERGEKLVFPQATELFGAKKNAFQLEKSQYIRLTDKATGAVRVERGEKVVFPTPTEDVETARIENAVLVDDETAALVLCKESAQQRLVTGKGPFFPGPYEEILEVRKLLRVEPHEVAIVKDNNGVFHFYNDHDPRDNASSNLGAAFFLPPHHNLVTMWWGSGTSAEDLQQNIVRNSKNVAYKIPVEKVDTRAQYAFFEYNVRTSDKVELTLEGTIFWQIVNVPKMIAQTSDPKGDVWYHARSVLIQAVSRVTFEYFMANFNAVVMNATATDAKLYEDRGAVVHNLDVTRYQCIDQRTEAVLQEIIQETTNRINRMQKQSLENEVAEARLSGEIDIERRRGDLIQAKTDNEKRLAMMQGEASGLRLAYNALSFLDHLNGSVSDPDARLELFKFFEEQRTAIDRMHELASGKANLFLTPQDLQLKVQMPAPA